MTSLHPVTPPLMSEFRSTGFRMPDTAFRFANPPGFRSDAEPRFGLATPPLQRPIVQIPIPCTFPHASDTPSTSQTRPDFEVTFPPVSLSRCLTTTLLRRPFVPLPPSRTQPLGGNSLLMHNQPTPTAAFHEIRLRCGCRRIIKMPLPLAFPRQVGSASAASQPR